MPVPIRDSRNCAYTGLVLRTSLGLALVLIVASAACGRVNYDPVGVTGDLDAGTLLIDASKDGIDAGANCASAAVTGSYNGDGTSGRVIDTGVQPALVILQSDTSKEAIIRMATMPADTSKSLAGEQALATGMISHATKGFTVGADMRVNQVGQPYHWLALPLSVGVAGGEYDGNGASQSITGLGFGPEWVLVADEGDGAPVVHMQHPSNFTFRLDVGAGVPNGVVSLDADGFSLGSRPFSNDAGRHFHYVAWRSTPGIIATGGYAGNGAQRRDISGLGVTPSYVMTHGLSNGVMHRFESLAVGAALAVVAQAPIAGTITDFGLDMFTLGSNGAVNGQGVDYSYSAFATCSPSTATRN